MRRSGSGFTVKNTNPVINAGELNKRLTIQYAAITRNTDGAEINIWTTLSTVYGKIRPLPGRSKEYIGADQVIAEASLEITIRYKTGINPRMRFKYGNKIYEILFIQNTNEANVQLVCACKEVVA